MTNEAELIEELRQGSAAAFSEIHRMYAPRLSAFCMRWVKCREDAEDVVQEVFAKLWNERANIRQTETLSSLIFIMARHHLINAFHATLRSPVFEDYVGYCDRLSSADSDPVEYNEFVAIVNRAVDMLPPARRNIVRMSKFGGRTNSEIAEELGLKEQTVKNTLSTGLKELRDYLQRYIPDMLPVLLFLVNFTILKVLSPK